MPRRTHSNPVHLRCRNTMRPIIEVSGVRKTYGTVAILATGAKGTTTKSQVLVCPNPHSSPPPRT
jgi:hypothetical protein